MRWHRGARNRGPQDVLSVSLALGQHPGAWKPSLASPDDSPCQHLMSHSCWQMGGTSHPHTEDSARPGCRLSRCHQPRSPAPDGGRHGLPGGGVQRPGLRSPGPPRE